MNMILIITIIIAIAMYMCLQINITRRFPAVSRTLHTFTNFFNIKMHWFKKTKTKGKQERLETLLRQMDNAKIIAQHQ